MTDAKQGMFASAVPQNTPRPAYPSDLREKAVEGEVLVNYTVLSDGSVADATAVGDSPFAMAAVQAVELWQFEPARRGGLAVQSERSSRFVFRLNAGTP